MVLVGSFHSPHLTSSGSIRRPSSFTSSRKERTSEEPNRKVRDDERLDQDMRKDDERQRSEEAASHLAGPARLSGFASHFTPVPLTISSAEGLGLRRDGRGTSVERSEASEDTKPEPSRRRPLLTVTAITNQSRLFLTSPSTPTLSLRLFTFRSVAEVGVG